MSIFKSAVVYRLLEPIIDKFPALSDKEIIEPGSQDARRIGWTPPLHGEGLEFPVLPSTSIICMSVIEKKVQPKAIKRALDEKVAEFKQDNGNPPSRKAIQEMRDDIVFAAIPGIMPVEKKIQAYIDEENMLFVVDTGSHKQAEELCRLLRETIGSLRIIPIATSRKPETAMLSWVNDDSAPPILTMGGSATFKNPKDLSVTAKAVHLGMDGSAVSGIIEEGLVPQDLSLSLQCEAGNFDFTLIDDFRLKKIKFSAGLMEIDEEIEDAYSHYKASMLINCDVISKTICQLVDLFGGHYEE